MSRPFDTSQGDPVATDRGRLVSRLLSAGVQADQEASLNRVIRVANAAALAAGCGAIPFIPFLYYTTGSPVASLCAIYIAACLSVPWINRAGHFVAARLVLIAAVTVTTSIFLWLYGYGVGVQAAYLVSISFTMVAFREGERRYRNGAIGFVLLAMLIALTVNVFTPPLLGAISPASGVTFSYMVVFGTLLCIATLIYFYVRRTEEIETQLKDALARNKSLLAESDAANRSLEESRKGLVRQSAQLVTANEELRVQREEVERASRYKSDFLANMSHELRTPLNSMLLLSRELMDNRHGHLDEEEVECAGIVHQSGQSLLALINDILDLSKVEAGKVELNLEIVPLAPFLDSLRSRYGPLAEEKGLRFEVEIDPALPPKIHTDPLRLQQIITNLVSNALKFTQQGVVSLRVAPRAGPDPEQRQLQFAVHDTGIGIARENLEKIFMAFEQADASTARKFGGTGLGLSLSRSLAGLFGGELMVESEPGRGSTFTLVLPYMEIPETPVEAMPAESPPEPAGDETFRTEAIRPDERFEGRTVLIIDDDMRNVFSLARVLGKAGFRVIKAASAEMGLGALNEQPETVDVVCMDIMMPGMNGLDAMRKIRADDRFGNLPIIALTAKAMKGDRDACIEAGATDFLAKPIDLDALLDILHRCLDGR